MKKIKRKLLISRTLQLISQQLSGFCRPIRPTTYPIIKEILIFDLANCDTLKKTLFCFHFHFVLQNTNFSYLKKTELLFGLIIVIPHWLYTAQRSQEDVSALMKDVGKAWKKVKSDRKEMARLGKLADDNEKLLHMKITDMDERQKRQRTTAITGKMEQYVSILE